MTGTIYIATNQTNNKIYVGQTCVPVSKRIEQHIRGSNCLPFGSALRKYGVDGFNIQEFVYNRESLNEWEQYFIQKLKSIHPDGYNLTSGGCQNFQISESTRRKMSLSTLGELNPMYGKPCSEERKAKIGAKTKERMTHPENRQRISDALRGKRKGVELTTEHKRKISESNKGRAVNEKTRVAVGDANRRRLWSAEMRDSVRQRMRGNEYHLSRLPITDETRKKLSEANQGVNNPRFGVRLSEDTKEKIRQKALGRPGGMKGKHHTEETKEKLRACWAKKGGADES